MKTIYYLLITMLLWTSPCFGQLLRYENMIKDNNYDLCILDQLEDSLVIAYDSNYRIHRSYLLKQLKNGQYEIMREGREVYVPDFTRAYICVDDTLLNLQNEPIDTIRTMPYPLKYLGDWRGQSLFANHERLFFQDGRTIGLRGSVYCEPSDSPDSILLCSGVRKLEVAIEDVYDSGRIHPEQDTTLCHLKHRYSSRGTQIPFEVTLDLEIEIPIGQTAHDQAIRDWMITTLMSQAFNIEIEDDEPVVTGLSASDFEWLVENYASLWKASEAARSIQRDYNKEFHELTIHRVMDTSEYSTYFLCYISINDGLEEMPFTYYITFVKESCQILEAAHVVIPSHLPDMRSLVLDHLQGIFDQRGESYDRKKVLEYLNANASSGVIDGLSYLDRQDGVYACDHWAGWTVSSMGPIQECDLPLPHMALLPEGISLSYHLGQIAPCLYGEYLILLPYTSVGKYLIDSCLPPPSWQPELDQFIVFPTLREATERFN